MKIYNLFPLLAGRLHEWGPHLQRAAAMGFDWLFVNPIQQLGRSGSLYSIADYFRINPAFVNPRSRKSPEDQVRGLVRTAENLGQRVMIDLVINHCAIDSSLVKEHPEWFVKDDHGNVVNPWCMEGNERIVWHDLAQFDHRHTSDPEGLLQYCGDIVEFLVDLGFRGFRCDAAYQIPPHFWERLIGRIRHTNPDVTFLAETLGCTPQETKETARAGFDYLFNSSKWWDFHSPWLMEQHQLTRDLAPSISFPESHDTERLFTESGQNVEAMKQRYLFAALFSAGVMMPIGYEFGFTKKLHVVSTGPEHWEETPVDLIDFITRVNRIKSSHPVFQEESLTQILDHPNPAILLMWKAATRTKGEALIILNKDPWNRQYFHTDDLYQYIQSPPPLVDVSTEWPLDYLSTPFQFDLLPGMARVLVTAPR